LVAPPLLRRARARWSHERGRKTTALSANLDLNFGEGCCASGIRDRRGERLFSLFDVRSPDHSRRKKIHHG